MVIMIIVHKLYAFDAYLNAIIRIFCVSVSINFDWWCRSDSSDNGVHLSYSLAGSKKTRTRTVYSICFSWNLGTQHVYGF